MPVRYKRFYKRFSGANIQQQNPKNDNYKNNTPPTAPHCIMQLTDESLSNLEANYIKKGVAVGGIYTLRQVRHEILRRDAIGYNGELIVQTILKLCKAAHDSQTTYVQLYNTLWPADQWIGHGSLTKIKRALGAAILYCIDNNLPVVTTLVVRTNTRELSPKAVENIYNTCKALGKNIRHNAENFALEQAIAALELVDNIAAAA